MSNFVHASRSHKHFSFEASKPLNLSFFFFFYFFFSLPFCRNIFSTKLVRFVVACTYQCESTRFLVLLSLSSVHSVTLDLTPSPQQNKYFLICRWQRPRDLWYALCRVQLYILRLRVVISTYSTWYVYICVYYMRLRVNVMYV